jgi:hypothetical protein
MIRVMTARGLQVALAKVIRAMGVKEFAAKVAGAGHVRVLQKDRRECAARRWRSALNSSVSGELVISTDRWSRTEKGDSG